jgi:threonine dehydratase
LSAPLRPSIGEVLEASRRLGTQVRRTPLEPSAWLSEITGAEVLLKLENLQRTGSFKLRGALNAVAALPASERAKGLITASAGNHGLGVAMAARLLGALATAFLPAGAALIKRRRIEMLGAEIREVGRDYDEAHAAALALATEQGRPYIHGFSDPLVMAGQGTVGLEILQERPDVRTLLVPVGGGGLIGGIGVAARALAPGARVIGVQSTATAAMHASLRAGRVVSVPPAPTLCDGLAGDIDEPSFAVAARVIDEMLLVEEHAIAAAVRAFYGEEALVAEPSAAVVIAALLEARVAAAGPIAAVVSGGNLDAVVLARLLRGSAAE